MRKTYTFPVESSFLNKEECLRQAGNILKMGLIEGMSQRQIAMEIHFHARVCHLFRHRNGRLSRWLVRHADPIDLCDFGDTLFRRMIFFLVWFVPGKERGNDSGNR